MDVTPTQTTGFLQLYWVFGHTPREVALVASSWGTVEAMHALVEISAGQSNTRLSRSAKAICETSVKRRDV
ncbi:hypothetical protein RRG08_003900 [Elysia crispata]|uniref:Uncharacterized protein n=1 Tax=Elysia crispata TaxID=231223 RepID=A0AAE1D4B5_9GAST|nr:hypothetical protein RRG08_003900 [Elysia crispata]